MASPQRPPEFRAEAVRIALTSGLSRRQVASDLGVGFSTLNTWVRQDQANPAKPAAQSELERELTELRRENRLLRDLQGSANSPGDCLPTARGTS